MDVPQIFLISNSDLSDYDFQVLMDSLIRDLPAQKRHNFTLSISNITEAAVDRKHESIQQYIWLEAFKSGLLATLPAVGILRDDVEKLKVKLKRYQVIFGVDDESLELIAKDFKVSVEQL
ncbi:Interferon-inducible GTPase 1 [Cricetulus griseus]|nr:Interferon-inducible GTPase 1 [Cricetulus griseus]